MKNRFLLLIFLVVPLLLTAAPAYAGKQAICHFPPGNPDNWHTIMVSDNAVASHLENHGDIMGSCAESCETLCDDGNFCTQDVFSVADGDCVCNSGERPAVECDDGNECTEDSCNAASGCVTDTSAQDGMACTDSSDPSGSYECAGGNCETSICTPDNVSTSVFFVTSTTHQGDFGGALAADAICQERAEAAGLEGCFWAWVSDETTSPRQRFSRSATRYEDVNGNFLAAGFNDITACPDCIYINNPLQYDENGNSFWPWSGDDGIYAGVWTGTTTTGDFFDALPDYPGACGTNWNSKDPLDTGLAGRVSQYGNTSNGHSWTAVQAQKCDYRNRIYCVQQ